MSIPRASVLHSIYIHEQYSNHISLQEWLPIVFASKVVSAVLFDFEI